MSVLMSSNSAPRSPDEGPPARHRGVVGRQFLVIAVGLVVGAAMVVLGLWQLRVYAQQGQDAAAARAAEPAVQLMEVAPPGQPITDGYGRTVRFTGEYDPALQLLVPVEDQPDRFRVLTGLEQRDGTVIPVVRGEVSGTEAPPVPSGTVEQTGVLLPSETADDRSMPEGQIATIRLASLAQKWTKPLVSGYVTLPAGEARDQRLDPAQLELPEGEGRLRNGAYAFQWWIFAAFAVGMSIRMARDFGTRKDFDEMQAAEEAEKAQQARSEDGATDDV